MRTLAERISDFQKQREAALASMSEITELAEAEERTFTEDENTRFDAANETIHNLDQQVKRLEAMQTASKAAAKPASDGGAYDLGKETPRITVHRNLPKGIAFTRYALALMCSKNLGDAEVFAQRKSAWGDTPEVVRMLQIARSIGGPNLMTRAAVPAGTTTDPTFAAPLVEYQTVAGEFIELLRPASIIGQIEGFRRVPFGVRIPRQTVSASAQWVGEGKSKPVSREGFDAVTVPWAKIAVIVAITEELARFSTPSAETLIRDDLVKAISDYMNSQFIDPDVAGTANVSPASVTNAGTAHVSSGATTADIISDIATLTTAIAAANLPLTGLVWVMNPRTKINLSMQRTAQDVYAFPELGQDRLRGYPVVASTAVPITGANNETIIALIAPNQIMLADDGSVTLDTSNEASVQMDSAPTTPPAPMVSFWQQNLLGIRAERFVWWQLANAQAVQYLTGVTY